jgi:hypothetical protein
LAHECCCKCAVHGTPALDHKLRGGGESDGHLLREYGYCTSCTSNAIGPPT